MMQVDKSRVEFLVTAAMVEETAAFLASRTKTIEALARDLTVRGLERLALVGCGSSRAAGQAGKYLADRYGRVPADAYTGWEFCDNPPAWLGPDTAVVLISHSGRTEEVVCALQTARQRGARTVAIVNSASGNPLADGADAVIDYRAHAMWECQLLAVYQLVLGCILQTGDSAPARQILSDLPRVPAVLGHWIASWEEPARELAERAGRWKGFYTVTAGPLLSLAYKEGVITNMEFTWGHGAVIESGEFRHGPLEITAAGVPFLFLLGTDPSRHTTQRALAFAQRYTEDLVVLDYATFAQGLHADLAPMVMFVPLEWLSYYLALARDHNPDDRRYYNVVPY